MDALEATPRVEGALRQLRGFRFFIWRTSKPSWGFTSLALDGLADFAPRFVAILEVWPHQPVAGFRHLQAWRLLGCSLGFALGHHSDPLHRHPRAGEGR